MDKSAKPAVPEVSAQKLATFAANVRKFYQSIPLGDKHDRRASKLYGKKESSNG